jgi:hypothetical protein
VGKGFAQDIRDSLGRAFADGYLGEQGHQASTGVVVEESPGRGTRLSQAQRLPRKIVGVGGASNGLATRVFGDSLARALAAGLRLLRSLLFRSHGQRWEEQRDRAAASKMVERKRKIWNVAECCAKWVALNLIGRAQRDARSQKLTFIWHEPINLEKLKFVDVTETSKRRDNSMQRSSSAALVNEDRGRVLKDRGKVSEAC